MTDQEWFYVPHAEVAAYIADGWIDTGETVDHHGVHSHHMYRYVDDGGDDPMDNVNVMATAVGAENGEIAITLVTEMGTQVFALTADKAASLGAKIFRAMSDLVPNSAGRAGAAASPRNDGSDPVPG